MPVLATIATITLLRGGGNSAGPFFDPEILREMLSESQEYVDYNEMQSALSIAERLESLLEHYSSKVEKSIDAYAEELSNPETNATDLIARLEPIDRERAQVLRSVIEYRGQLLGVLDASSWTAVFG